MTRGTVYKRGEVWWIKYYRNGKPFFESAKTSKKTVANELLKKRLGEAADGKLPGVNFERVTVKELMEDFVRDRHVNGKSVKDAETRLRNLRPFFGDKRAVDITTPKVNEYVQARMIEGAAAATVNRELSALKRMLSLGARQTPPKVDKIPHIRLLKENNIRKGFFEHGDFLALRNALPDYLKDFCTFAYKSGWRISEVEDLTWGRVDRVQGIVRLDPGETKNDEGRTLYLDEEMKEIFNRKWEERKRSGTLLPYVFLNAKGNDKIKRFDKTWKGACLKAGIGKRLFHDFRRTACRNLIRAGVPQVVCMAVSGHKTASVFSRYNIVSDSDLRLAAQKQEEYLSTMVTKTVTIADFQEKKESHNRANSL